MRENEFGQPIGDDLGSWVPPAGPPNHSVIRGHYVTLEPLQRTQHAIPLFHVYRRSDPSMWTYLSAGPFADAAELGQVIGELERDPTIHPYAVMVDNEALGFLTHMRIRPADGAIEIGWVTFSTELQRTRASTEAQFLLLDHAFGSGFRRVEWKCDSLNASSREAAERLGYTPEGVFAKATHYKGRSRDTAWFSMTDDMWPKVHAGMKAWLDPSNFDENGVQKSRLAHLGRPL